MQRGLCLLYSISWFWFPALLQVVVPLPCPSVEHRCFVMVTYFVVTKAPYLQTKVARL